MVNTMRIASIGVKNRVSKNAPTVGVPCKRVAEEMVLLLKILFTCDEAIKSLSVGLEAYLMLQGWKNLKEYGRNLCKY